MSLRWNINLPSEVDQADIGDGDIVRIIVFEDKQANGANAAVLDILETATINSHRNMAAKTRFRILRDFKITLNRQVAVTDGTNTSTSPLLTYTRSMWKKVNIGIEFDGASGIITEVVTSNLACLYISAEGLASITDQECRIFYHG